MIFYFMLHNLMRHCMCWADLQPYDSPLQHQFIPPLQLMLGSSCHIVHSPPALGIPISVQVISSALAQQSALRGCMLHEGEWRMYLPDHPKRPYTFLIVPHQVLYICNFWFACLLFLRWLGQISLRFTLYINILITVSGMK